MTILYFVILLSVIVTIHEFGHLIAAKIFGVYCFEFSIGMGPLLWKKKTKETQYSIRALPIGGYVSMAGETDGDQMYPDVAVPEGRRLTEAKTWKRIIIMLAGVTMNFLLAWLIFSLCALYSGSIGTAPDATIGEVVAGSPAEAAGLMAGDKIIKIVDANGAVCKPETFADMQIFTAQNEKELTYTVVREGEELTVTMTPRLDEESGRYLIGIISTTGGVVPVNLLNCWYYGFTEMAAVSRALLMVLRALFHGSGLGNLSGPIGIYEATETYAAMGIMAFLLLMAQISVNVGIFNLLPLPVLDGGQIVITLCEAALHRTISERVKEIILAACWVLLIGIMLFATFNDITRILFQS